MAGYIGSKAAVTQADGYTKTEADGRYVEGDDTLYVDQTNNRVGVGTTSPSNPITVDAANALGSTFTGTTAGEGIRVRQTSYTANNYVSLIEAPYVNTASQPAVRIGAKFSGSGSSLAFGTTNSYGSGITNTAMTIDSSGNLLVGTSSVTPNPGVSLRPDGNVTCGNSAGGSGFEFVNFRRSATQIGSITQSGTTSVSYNTSSDHRLKENVTDVTDGIARVKQLEPKRFNFIADPDKTVDGFLAHQAQAIVPEAVTGTHNEVDDDGNPVMQGIDQSKLVPLLTAALQEAITEIETLKTKVAALEAGE